MATGDTWNQSMRDLDKPPRPVRPDPAPCHASAATNRSTTPAGTFNAIKMRIFTQLDDETFWRYPTQCNYLVWYAPAVGAMVREEQRSYYREKDRHATAATVPGQNATIELVSFTPGAR